MIVIELNEANFDLIARLPSDSLPTHLSKFLGNKSWITSTGLEDSSSEPWINWVTFHTGNDASQHGVKTLDEQPHHTNGTQIFELLEDSGATVGVLGCMNASNSCKDPAFFLPDPWSTVKPSDDYLIEKTHEMLRQVVSENASGRVSLSSSITIINILWRVRNHLSLISLGKIALQATRKKWYKVLFLDLLLFGLMRYLITTRQPKVTFAFLNGLAHLQHHYLFNFRSNSSNQKNPTWYLPRDADPCLDYLIHLECLFQYLNEAEANGQEWILLTGLSQQNETKPHYYYRLKDPIKLISKLELNLPEKIQVTKLMSRDFKIRFPDPSVRNLAAEALRHVTINGKSCIEVTELNESDVFCTFSYGKEITTETLIRYEHKAVRLKEHVAFVAIKNAKHQSQGYLYSSKRLCSTLDKLANASGEIDLANLGRSMPKIVLSSLNKTENKKV